MKVFDGVFGSHRERVEPDLLIAVPQQVAAVTSVGEQKGLRSMAGEVAVIPPQILEQVWAAICPAPQLRGILGTHVPS